MEQALEIVDLHHDYGKRRALVGVTLSVPRQKSLAILGPNGGGKTTLFKILSTLLALQQGKVTLAGMDITTQGDCVRKTIGVVFQAPGLDKKLTVHENLLHQGHLYGLYGKQLRERITQLTERLGVANRLNNYVEELSGGLQRRVELARSLLHRPEILLLDEPTTGLDPSARLDFWQLIAQLREEDSTTVIFTTHLFEEAERSDLSAILDQGHLVAMDSPDDLKAQIGGNIITLKAQNLPETKAKLYEKFNLDAAIVQDALRIETPDAQEILPGILRELEGVIDSITLSKPTLEDVFVRRTGKKFK